MVSCQRTSNCLRPGYCCKFSWNSCRADCFTNIIYKIWYGVHASYLWCNCGIFNWIESIVRPKGFDISQAGNLGGALLIGGIVGAAIIPLLSDKLHKRKV